MWRVTETEEDYDKELEVPGTWVGESVKRVAMVTWTRETPLPHPEEPTKMS